MHSHILYQIVDRMFSPARTTASPGSNHPWDGASCFQSSKKDVTFERRSSNIGLFQRFVHRKIEIDKEKIDVREQQRSNEQDLIGRSVKVHEQTSLPQSAGKTASRGRPSSRLISSYQLTKVHRQNTMYPPLPMASTSMSSS